MFKNLFQKPVAIEPAFYENGSEILGVFPIHDSNNKILLPKYPENLYQVDFGQNIFVDLQFPFPLLSLFIEKKKEKFVEIRRDSDR